MAISEEVLGWSGGPQGKAVHHRTHPGEGVSVLQTTSEMDRYLGVPARSTHRLVIVHGAGTTTRGIPREEDRAQKTISASMSSALKAPVIHNSDCLR